MNQNTFMLMRGRWHLNNLSAAVPGLAMTVLLRRIKQRAVERERCKDKDHREGLSHLCRHFAKEK